MSKLYASSLVAATSVFVSAQYTLVSYGATALHFEPVSDVNALSNECFKRKITLKLHKSLQQPRVDAETNLVDVVFQTMGGFTKPTPYTHLDSFVCNMRHYYSTNSNKSYECAVKDLKSAFANDEYPTTVYSIHSVIDGCTCSHYYGPTAAVEAQIEADFDCYDHHGLVECEGQQMDNVALVRVVALIDTPDNTDYTADIGAPEWLPQDSNLAAPGLLNDAQQDAVEHDIDVMLMFTPAAMQHKATYAAGHTPLEVRNAA